MNPVRAESLLATLYSSSVVLSIVSIVSIVVPWQHWKGTLDICLNMECSCILYGGTTFSTFMGGDDKVCKFGVYSLVPGAIIGLCLGVYHGYRSCFNRKFDDPRVVSETTYYNRNSNSGEMVVVTSIQRPPFRQWTASAFLAIIVICLSLSHVVVVTDGYYKSCEQYKRNLVKLVNAPSRVADVIHNRLDCSAVLDYMDYLQPDANNLIRGEQINTKVALQLAIVTTWFNLFVWTTIMGINFLMAKRRSNSLGDNYCCCCS